MTTRAVLRTLAVVAALAAPLVGARASSAQEGPTSTEARAADEFEAGLTALEQSKFREAAEHFEASSLLELNGAALFAAAKAWLAEADRARAADSFAAALMSSLLRPAEAAYAEKQLTALEGELAVVELTGDASMRVQLGDHAPLSPPATMHTEPGTITLVVESGGIKKNIELTLVAGQRMPLDLRPALVDTPAALDPPDPPESSEPT